MTRVVVIDEPAGGGGTVGADGLASLVTWGADLADDQALAAPSLGGALWAKLIGARGAHGNPAPSRGSETLFLLGLGVPVSKLLSECCACERRQAVPVGQV